MPPPWPTRPRCGPGVRPDNTSRQAVAGRSREEARTGFLLLCGDAPTGEPRTDHSPPAAGKATAESTSPPTAGGNRAPTRTARGQREHRSPAGARAGPRARCRQLPDASTGAGSSRSKNVEKISLTDTLPVSQRPPNSTNRRQTDVNRLHRNTATQTLQIPQYRIPEEMLNSREFEEANREKDFTQLKAINTPATA